MKKFDKNTDVNNGKSEVSSKQRRKVLGTVAWG